MPECVPLHPPRPYGARKGGEPCPTPRTYDTFGLHQILAVQGWHGVWWIAGQHVVQPVYLLALVTRTTR